MIIHVLCLRCVFAHQVCLGLFLLMLSVNSKISASTEASTLDYAQPDSKFQYEFYVSFESRLSIHSMHPQHLNYENHPNHQELNAHNSNMSSLMSKVPNCTNPIKKRAVGDQRTESMPFAKLVGRRV